MAGSASASTIIAGASLALTAAGTVMNVMGQSRQAQAGADQGAYMAQVAQRNAEIQQRNAVLAERNATLAEQQGRVAEDKARVRTAGVIGAQRAALASQGGDVNSGSNLDIVGDTASAGESDALTLRSNAAMRAYGYRIEGLGAETAAGSAQAQAGLYSMMGANAMNALPYGIGSSLLGGASSLGDKALSYSKFWGGGTANKFTGSIGDATQVYM